MAPHIMRIWGSVALALPGVPWGPSGLSAGSLTHPPVEIAPGR